MVIWCFGTWLDYDFPFSWDFIIPTDELIFFRGVVLPPTRIIIFWHTSKIQYQYPSFYVEYHLSDYGVFGHLQFLGWFSSQAGKLLWNLWVFDNLEPQKHDHHCPIEASWVLGYSHGNSQKSTSCLWKHTSQRLHNMAVAGAILELHQLDSKPSWTNWSSRDVPWDTPWLSKKIGGKWGKGLLRVLRCSRSPPVAVADFPTHPSARPSQSKIHGWGKEKITIYPRSLTKNCKIKALGDFGVLN